MFNESIMKIDIFKSTEKEKHIHNFLELLYVIKGDVFVKVESNEYIMKKDDLLLVNVNDDYRIEYLRKHIEQMQEAIKDGVNLIGYTPWSCMDLISLSGGEMKKRYGFICVDKDNDGNGTLKHIKKKSFYWYKDVIEANGLI